MEGRRSLVLFALAELRSVPLREITPHGRLPFASTQVGWLKLTMRAVGRATPGIAIVVLPLIVLAVATEVGDAERAPGWITWVWASALCAINAVFLLIGPRLWNALITAAVAIDEVVIDEQERVTIATWLRRHYRHRWAQTLVMLAGGLVGAGLLWWIDAESGFALTIGPGEYVVMFVTASLATNGLWILWWVAGLIPVLGRQRSLRLYWNHPARTPAIAFLNRALWKAGAAISLGMVLLAFAVQGQPSPFTSWETIPSAWVVAVVAECIAFGIVAVIFVRDGVWAQRQVFALVRLHIDRAWEPVQQRLNVLERVYPRPRRRAAAAVLYYAELDRHFDGLRTVDLKLGWALAWATSIFGAAASIIAAALTISPG